MFICLSKGGDYVFSHYEASAAEGKRKYQDSRQHRRRTDEHDPEGGVLCNENLREPAEFLNEHNEGQDEKAHRKRGNDGEIDELVDPSHTAARLAQRPGGGKVTP